MTIDIAFARIPTQHHGTAAVDSTFAYMDFLYGCWPPLPVRTTATRSVTT